MSSAPRLKILSFVSEQYYLSVSVVTSATCHRSCTFVWVQGVSLVLSSCATLKHTPERGTLACLSAAMRRSLAAFKRQELASSLEAFKAFNYHPGNELLKVHPLIAFLSAVKSPFVVVT